MATILPFATTTVCSRRTRSLSIGMTAAWPNATTFAAGCRSDACAAAHTAKTTDSARIRDLGNESIVLSPPRSNARAVSRARVRPARQGHQIPLSLGSTCVSQHGIHEFTRVERLLKNWGFRKILGEL